MQIERLGSSRAPLQWCAVQSSIGGGADREAWQLGRRQQAGPQYQCQQQAGDGQSPQCCHSAAIVRTASPVAIALCAAVLADLSGGGRVDDAASPTVGLRSRGALQAFSAPIGALVL
jgi:hypothetical protein